MTILRRVFLLLSALALTACGGGGGSAGSPGFGPGSDSAGGTLTPTLTVTLSNPTVSSAAPVTVSAVVDDGAGNKLNGVVVNFISVGGLGKFDAQSALTQNGGVATVVLSPANPATSGADQVQATAVVGSTSLTTTAGFSLVASQASITSFTTSAGATAAAPLSAYGQTVLTVGLTGAAPSTPVSVSISSACATAGKATISPASFTATTSSVPVTYLDKGCGATISSDTLTASIAGANSQQALQLFLSSPQANNIVFVSATPQNIYLQSTGLTTSSQVVFQVNDFANNPLPGQVVSMNLSTFAGGITINGGSSAVTQTTDANGQVTALVNSGTVPTPVRVTATLSGGISTVSSSLGIAVGLPSERNFSLSERTFNIEGMNIDGTSNSYTVIASDRLGNPVPDGTAINFVSEGGQVQAIAFTKSSGGLSSAVASFQSSLPKPADGRITVLAYALGEKSFVDTDGDNVFTAGPDPFQDLGNPYIDTLYNGIYGSSPNNQFIQQSPVGNSACNSTPPSQLTEVLQIDRSIPSQPVTCTGSWGKSYVRRAIETILSTSAARPVWGTSTPATLYVPDLASCSPIVLTVPNNDSSSPAYASDGSPIKATYYPLGTGGLYNTGAAGAIGFYVSDANGVAWNPVAAGSTVAVSATNGLAVNVAGGTPVPNSLRPTLAAVNYSFGTGVFSGSLTISITSPSGTGTAVTLPITQNAPPAGYVRCP